MILANHDPASTILMHELMNVEAIANNLPFNLMFAVSNLMGYGLYEPNIYTLEMFSYAMCGIRILNVPAST